MKVPLERKILLGFGAALVVMLFAGTASWWNLRRFEATFLRVDHTHQVLIRLEQALTGLLSMQSSTRGFVLTGHDDMLEPYRRGGTLIDTSFRELRELTADNVLQQKRLAALLPVADQARAIMAGRIAFRQARGMDAATDTSAFLAGQQAVERFRVLIDEMNTEERLLLRQRFTSSEAAARATLATIVAASVLATAFVGFAGVVVHRDFRRRREAEESLRLLNEQLEQRVRDRTAQLEAANLAMSREIADRQRTQDSLRASEQRLRTTLDGMLEACQIIGPDWRYLYLNDTASVQNRRHKQAFLGRTMTECYPGIEHTATYAAIARCFTDRTSARLEQPFTFPDGTHAWFLVGIEPDPEGVAILSLEITEQKLAEERILQANATLEQRVRERTAQLEVLNGELEAFSYSVSHDLRAPLRHIDGFASLLGKHAATTLDEKGRRYLDTISSAAQQMGRLIDDLLAFSRIGRAPLKLQLVDHAALLAAARAEGRYELNGRTIAWEIGRLPAVQADPALLRQIWINLLDNAVKYSGKNPAPRVVIAAETDLAKAEFVFSISDNGVGFDMAYADKLFGVFQRLHGPAEFEGTGIGLANVRRIVARHGGRTWAQSRVGEGATFYFSLPMPKDNPASSATASPPPAAPPVSASPRPHSLPIGR